MKRIPRVAVTAFCAGSLALGGLAAGITDTHAAAPYNASSTRQALATSAVLGGVTNAVPVQTTTTLPLLGAPLTIDVTSGPGGTLSSIAVNPAGGLTATKDTPDAVRFVNDAGTAKVQISSRHGGQNVEAKAGELADVAGPGSWSGDVFATGTATTVNFTTVANADGSPGITGVTSSDATAEIGAVMVRTNDESQEAVVKVRFTSGIQARTLTIRVGVSTDDDQTRAKVSVSLSRLTGQSLPSAEVVGAQVWNGLLCDGSAASIAYTVNADGSITGATANPAADVRAESSKGVSVTFATGERVRIRVKSSGDGAELSVSVDERIRCDVADPAVNTPVSTSVPDDDADDDAGDHAGDHVGDDQGHHGSDDAANHDANHDAGDDHETNGTAPSSTVAAGPNTTVDDHGDDDAASTITPTSNTVDDQSDDNGSGDDQSDDNHGGNASDDSNGGGGHHG